jgi:benzil reductase ((S)-benzoin forming)
MQIVITGVSGGIGYALAEFYLHKGNTVIGIGRNNVLSHENYTFLKCDLQDEKSIDLLKIPLKDEPVLLINNAGILGEVGRLTEIESASINAVFQVNIVAAMLMTQKLALTENELMVVNISSGAAKNPIPSWGAYCASKAALDMFSKVFFLEEKERGRSTKVYSIAPGIVDTPMQNQIRKSSSNSFSQVQKFIDFKENQELTNPIVVAEKIDRILALPYSEELLICSVRDLVD